MRHAAHEHAVGCEIHRTQFDVRFQEETVLIGGNFQHLADGRVFRIRDNTDAQSHDIRGQCYVFIEDWIQDFHLTLVPGMIRKERDDAQLAYFWHIPWPAHTIFRIVPWRKEMMESMLENTLIGFHTSQDCRNFLLTGGE